MQYVDIECVRDDNEDLPGARQGLDVGGARGAMFEVTAAQEPAAQEPVIANTHEDGKQENSA